MNKLLCCVLVIALCFVYSAVCNMDCYQPCGFSYAGYGAYGLGCASPCATPFAASAFAFPYAYGGYGAFGGLGYAGLGCGFGGLGYGLGCGRIC